MTRTCGSIAFSARIVAMSRWRSAKVATAVAAVRHGDDAVAETFQRLPDHEADGLLVIDEQHEFLSSHRHRRDRHGRIFRGARQRGEAQREGRAAARLADDLELPLVALHDRRRRRESEAGALAHLLRGEERLEGFLADLDRDADAGIGHADEDVRASRRRDLQ
jgi:hypothetical protein